MALPEDQLKKQELAIHEIIAATASQTLDLDRVLDTALEKVMQLMNVNNGGIFLLEPETGQYVLRRQKNLTEGFIREKGRVNLGEGCTGTAAKTGEIYCAYAMPERQFLCEDAERLMKLDCFVASPIKVKGKVVGVLELFAPSARRITADEASLITAVGNQIGIAIENAKLYQEAKNNVAKLTSLKEQLESANSELQKHLSREAYIAETLQKGLLPLELPAYKNYDIAVRYISATEAAYVGGDFYDFIPIDSNIGIIVGDISGSGVETTTLSSMVKNTIRAFALEDPTPSEVITRTNNVLYKEAPIDKYASVFFAILEPKTGKVIYSNAGHPPPMVVKVRGGTEIEELGFCTTALAMTSTMDCLQKEFDLEIGESFILYTDGLIEVRNAKNEFFGYSGLKNILLKQSPHSSADQVADQVLNAAEKLSGGSFTDDISLIIIKRV